MRSLLVERRLRYPFSSTSVIEQCASSADRIAKLEALVAGLLEQVARRLA